jgi:hypothetical protein
MPSSSIEVLERGRGGEWRGRPIDIMRCLSPKYGCTILAALESNYIMSKNVEIWGLLVEMTKFGI